MPKALTLSPFILRCNAAPVLCMQVAVAGGFVAGTNDSGVPIIKNPAADLLMEMMDNVLALTRYRLVDRLRSNILAVLVGH